VAHGRVRAEAVRDARRRQGGELPERGDPQPLQGDGQVGPRQRGDRPGREELGRPPGGDDQRRARLGGRARRQLGSEEAVGDAGGRRLARFAGLTLGDRLEQPRHDRLLTPEEPGRPAGGQGTDPEADRMRPRAHLGRPVDDAGEAPRLFSSRALF
jgi:hypothetical protein